MRNIYYIVVVIPVFLFISGCGLAGVAVVTAVTGGGGSSDKPVLLPNNKPAVFVTPPTRQVGNVVISYKLLDPDSDNCSVTVTYGINGADPVNVATPANTSETTTDLTSSPVGTDHTFTWNSVADVGAGLNAGVKIAIVANDGKGDSERQITSEFLVGNDAPVVQIQTPLGEQSGDVAIVFSIADSTADIGSLEVEFSLDNSNWFQAAPAAGISVSAILTAPDPGLSHVFVWDSLDNAGGVGSAISDTCLVRIKGSDSFESGAWAATGYFTIHNNFPPSAMIIEIGTPGVVSYRGVIPVTYRLYDSESDDLDVSFEWSHEDGVWLPMSEYPAGSGSVEFTEGKYGLASMPGGVEHSFLWNSLADTEEDYSFIRIRVVPSDPFQQGLEQETLFNSVLDNHRFGSMESSHTGSNTYTACVIGDFDNNGFGDVVMREISSADIEVATGGPNGFTSESAPISSNWAWFFIVGDFCNNDGVDDLAMIGVAPSQYLQVIEGVDGTGMNAADVRTYVTGAYINGITSGDFDNDGVTDVAAAGDGFVYVFAGTPGDYPAAPYSLGVGINLKSIAAADMDGDGIDDLLVASDDAGGNVAFIWPGKNGAPINNSDMIPYYTPGFDKMNQIVTADFNDDDVPDFAVSHTAHERISYWVGQPGSLPDNQSGSFVTAGFGPTGTDGPTGVVRFYVLDMNRDGVDDMLYTTEMWFTPFGESGPYEYHIIPGSPTGPDDPARVFYLGERFNSVVFEDMIGSGYPQMVYSSSITPFDSTLFLIPTANGPFNTPDAKEFVSDSEFSGASGDVSGDDLCDMAATTPSGISASFLVDTCGFRRDSGIDRAGGGWQYLAGTADFDNDGVNDLVLRALEDGYAYVYKGTAGSAPTVEPASMLPVGGATTYVRTGDMSGDGIADAAIPRTALSKDEVAVFLGEAGTGLSGNRSTLLPLGGPPSRIIVGDFDNNGIIEVVADIETAFLSPDTRYFPGPIDVGYNGSDFRQLLGVLGGSPAVGDFNGDGIDDLVYEGEQFGTNFAFVLGVHGTGLLNSNVVLRPKFSIVSNFIISDFNYDGCDDAVLIYGTQMELFLGNSVNGLEAAPAETFSPPASASRADVGDVNGDGYPDLVISLLGQGVSVYLNQDGTGITPSGVTQYNFGNNGGRVSIADINGDGIEDVICGYENGNLHYLPGTPNAGPRQDARGKLDNPGFASALQTADMNADGMADIVIVSSAPAGRLFLSQPGRQTYGFSLDSAGGIFRHLNQSGKYLAGFELNVPPGSVQNEIDVVALHPISRELPAPPGEFWRQISKPFLIIRETLTLMQNASLTLPISEAVADADWKDVNNAKISVFRYERENGAWTRWDFPGITVNETNRTVTISIDRFGYYAIGLKP